MSRFYDMLFGLSEALAFFVAVVAVLIHAYPMAAAYFALSCYARLMRRLP